MREENFLRYRLDVVRTMPEGAYKTALLESIQAKILSLARRSGLAEGVYTISESVRESTNLD